MYSMDHNTFQIPAAFLQWKQETPSEELGISACMSGDCQHMTLMRPFNHRAQLFGHSIEKASVI